MNRRSIAIVAGISIGLLVMSIFLLDRPLAQLVHHLGGEHSKLLQAGTSALEVVSGMTVSKFALGLAMILAGAILLIWKPVRHLGWVFLFIGCTHFTTRLITGVLKEVFQRLRPYEVLANNVSGSGFFSAHGGAFPSGHTTHFWALFFPLAYLFPKARIPLLIVPLFIAVARIGMNDHWLSDVLASIAICAAVTVLFIWIFRWPPVGAAGPNRAAKGSSRGIG